MPPALVFFLKIALAIRGLFWFHTIFKIVCASSVKNAGVILIGIALNSYIALGSIDFFFFFLRGRAQVSEGRERDRERQRETERNRENPMRGREKEKDGEREKWGSSSPDTGLKLSNCEIMT